MATTLIEAASWRGRVAADLAVFEVDEAAVRTIAPRLAPRLVVVTNLARDQLDRYGELATTAEHVRTAVEASAEAVLNADDPLVAACADAAPAAHLFGAVAAIKDKMPADAAMYGGGTAGGPGGDADLLLESSVPAGDGQEIRVRRRNGEHVTVSLQVPGPYNGYNATAALLAASALGVTAPVAASAIAAMPPAFGRGQVVEYRRRRVRLLLVKNPAGFNQVIRLLSAAEPGPVVIAINDLDADGRDVSWLWDARVEDLAGTRHRFGTSGIRADDMAVRLKYAGIECWSEPGLEAAVTRAIDDASAGETVHLVPTYTAMLRLLDVLQPGRDRREVWR